MRALRIPALLTFVSTLVTGSAFAAVSGAVINADGQPVSGAVIAVYAPETSAARLARLVSKTPVQTPLATTKTDAKGNFSFETPKLPVVDVRIDADGFAPDGVRIDSGDDVGTVMLSAASVKSGTITANGKPVAGATVAWGQHIVTTDAAGKYSIPDPAKWANVLMVYHPDFAVFDEFVSANADRKSLDRTLDAGVTIAGTVVGDDGKTPLANATIYVDDYPLATSAADGTFTVAHAPKKWERIEARTDTRAGMRVKSAAANIVIKTAKAATISGTVRDAKSQMPIAGANVLIGAGGMRGPRVGGTSQTLTDAKGNYSIVVLPGPHDVMVSRPGYSGAQVSANVAVGQNVVKNVLATQNGRISGSVVDEDSRPVSGARVAAQSVTREPFGGMMRMQQAPQMQYSGPDGRFTIRSESDTDVQIEAIKRGYPAARSTTVRVASGERKGGVVLTIPRGMAVSGRVLDQNGKPVSGVAVSASEATSGDGMNIRRVVMGAMRDRGDDVIRTAADGTFAMRVKGGSYDFAFKREGFAPKVLRAQAVTATTQPLEVKLDPSVEVTGRVTRKGVGVEGVTVTTIGESSASTTTGYDGSFRLTDLGPGQLMLNAMKLDESIQQMRTVTAPATDIVIDLPPGGRITGRVKDKATGAPVTAFQAGTSAPRGGGGMVFMMPPAMHSYTTDDGSFVIENVPTGQTQLVVNAPGYTTGRVSNLNVEEGKTLENIEVALDTGVKLSGRVTGPDGAGLSGVSVRQDMVSGRTMRMPGMGDASATTDANGEYTIEAVEPGEKSFVFQRGGYLQTTKSVTLEGKDARLDVQLSSGTRVTGVVVTEGGAPVADAAVRASSAADSGFGGKATRTDAQGNFTFDGMAPGHYTFSADKTGYADGILRDFDVAAGAPPRVVLKTGGVIYGHVSGLSATELTDTTVRASNVNGSAAAQVDASGNFRIEGAPSGTVRVSASSQQGFTGGRQSPVKSVQLEAGSSAQVDLEFRSDTVVRGRVTRGGQPVAGAMVSFFPRDSRAQTNARISADANGTYTVSGLDDATYAVNVFAADRNVSYSTTYDVKGSGTFDIDIKVSSVRGRVVDASTGEALADARVDFRPSDQSTVVMSRTAGTDSGGNFIVDSMSPGSYTAVADKEGYGNQVLDVTVTDNGASDVQFKLSPNPGVTLRVVDARDGQLLNAFVRVADAQGRTVYTPSFRMGGSAEEVKLTLAPGSYRATILAPGYATQVVPITSPAKQTIGLTPGGNLVIRSKSSTQQRGRLVMADGQTYPRGMDSLGIFMVDPSPGVTTVTNVAPGVYQLQLLDANERVLNSVQVVVRDGSAQQVEL